MSVELLDKTRKVNKLLQEKFDKNRLIFDDLCKILGEGLKANTLVISRKGKVLGSYSSPDLGPISGMLSDKVGEIIDKHLNERLTNILSTKENVNLETLGFSSSEVKNITAIVSPILISGKRLGHLFVYRKDNTFSIDDIILVEFGASVVGLETMRSEKEENDLENAKKSNLEMALGSLSRSEFEAVHYIFDNFEGVDGIVIASRIADNIGITRSVIVNALRKLESAGVIYSKSSGMKGTYVKIQNEYLKEMLENEKTL